MSVPKEISRKLEIYAFGHGGQFDIGSTEDGIQVAVKFHAHAFSPPPALSEMSPTSSQLCWRGFHRACCDPIISRLATIAAL